MDRFDLIEVITWTGLTSPLLSQSCPCSHLLSQTCPCGYLYEVKPVHVVTSIKANLSTWSLNRDNHMDRFDLIEVTTWTGLT
jgi:hypothetical protein